MTLFDDLDNEMARVPLDPQTADRLLAGAIAPEDAPPGFAELTRLLDAAREPNAGELAVDAGIVAAIAAEIRASSLNQPSIPRRKRLMKSTSFRPKAALAFVALAFAATTSIAVAGLPAAASDAARDVLAELGIVVGPDEERGRPATGAAEEGQASCAEETGGICTEAQMSPETLAMKARTTRGMAICSQATADEDAACTRRGREDGDAGAPVTTPNAGGTATADEASGGASSAGTATADEASGDASSAGSANSGSAPSGGGSAETGDAASGGASSAGTDTADSADDAASVGTSPAEAVSGAGSVATDAADAASGAGSDTAPTRP